MPSVSRALQLSTAVLFALAMVGLWRTPASFVEHESVWGLVDVAGLAEVHAFRSNLALQEDDPRRDKARPVDGKHDNTAAEGVALREPRGHYASLALVAKDSAHAAPLCGAIGDDALAAKVGMATPRVRWMGSELHVQPRGEARWVRGLWLGDSAAQMVVQAAGEVWRAPREMQPRWLLVSHADLSGWGAATVCAVPVQNARDVALLPGVAPALVPVLPVAVLRSRDYAEHASPIFAARASRRASVAFCVAFAGVLGALSVVLEGRRPLQAARVFDPSSELRVQGHLSRGPLAVALALSLVCTALAMVIWKG